MRVQVVQFAASLDVADNLRRIRQLAAAGGAEPIELLVVPEAAMHDFGSPERPLGPVAQAVDGEFVSALGELARGLDCTVVAGMFESSPDPDRPYNTLVVVSPDGDLLASHRKAILYDAFGYRESDRLLAGDGGPVTVALGDLTLGLLTCYELRFPEVSRGLVDAGADTLVVPAAWVPGTHKSQHWTTLLRARAIENTVYVVAAAQCAPRYVGHSMVVDPDGVVTADLGQQEGTVDALLTAAAIEDARRRNPSLANRRSGVGH